MQSFLADRKLTVQHHGLKSKEISATSGVLLGSVLRPFCLYKWHLPKLTTTKLKILLYYIANYIGSRMLQNNIDTISQWCEKNLLPLKASKCNQMTYTLKISAINCE